MKLLKYYTVALIVSVFFILASCTDTFEVHEKYSKDGETIYTNKVDTLSTFSGDKRIKITGYISNAFNVNEIVVYWNKGKNSQTFPYAKSSNSTDKLELIIDNLEEGPYQFEVYSKDSNGNKSVKMTTFGTVYGETYKANLEARAINTFAFNMSDMTAKVKFKINDELTRTTEVRYTNMNGEEVIKTLAAEDSEVVLEELDSSKKVDYRTFYVPTPIDDMGEETVLDVLESNWKTYNFPAFSSIFGNITIDPLLGGVKVNWSNPDDYIIGINLGYKVAGSSKVNLIKELSSILEVGSTSVEGMDGGSQTVNIIVTDAYGNSLIKNVTVAPMTLIKYDKTAWTIAGFSSEEPAEGAPNGLAKAAIDGNVNTFWHSAWNCSTCPVYPHHFIIDMGSVKTISKFEIFRRQGNSGGANVHEFWVSNDNVTYTKVATYNGALTTNSGYFVSAAANTQARYVKYLAVSGANTFTYLAEINVYGIE